VLGLCERLRASKVSYWMGDGWRSEWEGLSATARPHRSRQSRDKSQKGQKKKGREKPKTLLNVTEIQQLPVEHFNLLRKQLKSKQQRVVMIQQVCQFGIPHLIKKRRD